MRLTKGAITNLIANYKSVLTKMVAHNQASCKKHTAALLACLLMATAAPAMATTYVIDPAGGGTHTSLNNLMSDIGYDGLIAGDTITFLTGTDDSLTATIEFNDTGTLMLRMDGITSAEISPDGVTAFITVGNGKTLTLSAQDGKEIIISGFEKAITIETPNGTSGGDIVIGSIGNIGTITFKDNGDIGGTGGGALRGVTVRIVDGTNKFIDNKSSSVGGAIYGLDTVIITEGTNIFQNNIAEGNSGGAIYGENSVTISGGTNTFEENESAFGGGGAIGSGAIGTGTVAIDNGTNVFLRNSANNGGAIDGNGSVTINGGINEFTKNIATGNGAPGGGNGGAIFSETSVSIGGNSENAFIDNTALNGSGGAIASEGTVTINDGWNIFNENKAQNGGAIDGNGSVTIGGGVNIFTGNVATSNNPLEGIGGAIASSTGDVTFSGNDTIVAFIGNSADNVTSSAVYAGQDIILEAGATLFGEGGFWAERNIGFSNSFVELAGIIELNANTGAITFTDMTLQGNGELKGGDITIDSAGGGGLAVGTDGTITISAKLDINGKELAKDGAGTLNLTNTANDYTGAIDNKAGILNITSDDFVKTGKDLVLGTVTNNARLNFVGADGAFYKKSILMDGGIYSGTGTVGLQASLVNSDKSQNWADMLTFNNATVDNNPIISFTFESGSILKNMPDGGLLFADVSGIIGGNADGFSLDSASSTWGSYDLFITTPDETNYYLDKKFNPNKGKVYSEAAAAGLGQAVWMHGRLLFNATGEAARDAAKSNTTGVFAGYERVDSRFETGSHADVKGNNFAVAAGFKANEKTTWGVFGQMFKGDYDTDTGNGINSNGDMDAHDIGLFVEYRPAGQTETGAGHYYKGIVRAGRTSSDFRANNGLNNGYTTFSMGRNLFGMSFGGGYLKAMDQDRTADIYTHLIYTGLDGNTVTDNIGQKINFGSSNSFRLLTGARLNFNQTKKTGAYVGAALDYEFSGTADAYVDGFKTDTADIKGLTGILELGLVTKPNATTAINLGLQGYVGKKQGLGGTLTFNKLF